MAEFRAHLDQARKFQSQADYRSAERSLMLALEAATQLYNDPALVAEALQMLSLFYTQMGQHNEALAQADWALQVLKAKLGQQHPGLKPVLLAIAKLLRETGQTAEAVDVEREAATLRG